MKMMKIQRSLVCGRVLVLLRRQAGMAPGSVALAAGIGTTAFDTRMEKGDAFISLSRLRGYAAGLRVGGLKIQTWELVAAFEEVEQLLEADGHEISERGAFAPRAPKERRLQTSQRQQPTVDAAVRRAFSNLDLERGELGAEE